MEEVVVPINAREIRTNLQGMYALVRLQARMQQHNNSRLRIDFERVIWFDAHLAAMLMVIVRHAEERGNLISFRNLDDPIRLILSKNGFLARRHVDNFHTTLPLTEFDNTAAVDFSEYTRTHLRRQEMPSMTGALKGKFYEGLDELFANSCLHSRTQLDICVGGQFYPRQETLSFVIADGGRGIDGAYADNFAKRLRADKAIEWAMQPGSTTRLGDVPGGLGLKVIRSFVERNGGRLIIVSNRGYWCQSGKSVSSTPIPAPFPGTTVIFEIVTSDRKRYDLVRAPSANEIW